jgi:plastocyanin
MFESRIGKSQTGIFVIATALWLAAGTGLAAAEQLLTFKLATKDGRFYPETIEVPAGTRFKIVITNEGPGPEEFESNNPHREKVLAAGGTSFLIFPALKPGVYPFFGEFHPETAKGRIVVR